MGAASQELGPGVTRAWAFSLVPLALHMSPSCQLLLSCPRASRGVFDVRPVLSPLSGMDLGPLKTLSLFLAVSGEDRQTRAGVAVLCPARLGVSNGGQCGKWGLHLLHCSCDLGDRGVSTVAMEPTWSLKPCKAGRSPVRSSYVVVSMRSDADSDTPVTFTSADRCGSCAWRAAAP
jgi:hypothetical protein